MKTTRWMGLALALALVGCGGSSAEEASDDDSAGGEEHAHGGEGHEHEGHAEEHHHGEGDGEPHEHRMSDELRAFHDVLAPVYHMDPGAERAAATCAAASDWTGLAGGVSDDAVTAVSSLGTACGEGELDDAGVTNVEAGLESVHDAFHHAMEAWQQSQP